MASTNSDPVVVVLQLTGANDYLNTVIPYTNPLYRDNRPNVGVPEDKVLKSSMTRARSPSSMALATPSLPAPTSVRWTSGIPASRTK